MANAKSAWVQVIRLFWRLGIALIEKQTSSHDCLQHWLSLSIPNPKKFQENAWESWLATIAIKFIFTRRNALFQTLVTISKTEVVAKLESSVVLLGPSFDWRESTVTNGLHRKIRCVLSIIKNQDQNPNYTVISKVEVRVGL